MINLTKLISFVRALIAPKKLQLQLVKIKKTQPVPHWADFLRSSGGDKR